MIYSGQTIYIGKERVKQINKVQARKLFNKGEKIFLNACNMRLNNIWTSPLEIYLDELEPNFKYGGKSNYDIFIICNNFAEAKEKIKTGLKKIYQFDTVVNSFEYYNCCSERGKYSNFFIKD